MTSTATVSGLPTTASATTPAATAAANKALNMLLNSSDVTQALSSQSSSYLPPTSKQVLSTLWAMFDTSGKNTINKAEVQAAVQAEGGKPSNANALWAALNPTNLPSLNAGDFAYNTYLTKAVTTALPNIQAAVKTAQLQAGPAAGSTVLDGFISVGGSGSIISDVGEGSASVNIFA